MSSRSRIIVVDDFIVLCRLQAPGLLAVPYRSPLMGYICVCLPGFVSSERFDLRRFLGDGYLQIRPEQHCEFFLVIFQGQILIIQAAVSKYQNQASCFSRICATKHQIPYTTLLFVAFGSFLIHVIVSQPVLQTSIRHSSQLPHVPPATFPKRRAREGSSRSHSLHPRTEGGMPFISLSAAASPERVGNKRKLGVLFGRKTAGPTVKIQAVPLLTPAPPHLCSPLPAQI